MSFAGEISRCPRPFDQARAADARAAFSDLAPQTVDLISGTAGCSPYLADLLRREGRWLRTALDAPDTAMTQLCQIAPDLSGADLGVALRENKRRAALLTALADLGGVWSLEQVTQALTNYADAAVAACISTLISAEVRAGRLPEDAQEGAGGMAVLAMGKMGAGELNYSSDIDLICLFDEQRYDPDDYHSVRAAFVRVTRKMTAILSERKGGGYVFRTDLRLRPDASVTPVCLSMEAAERYYESVGRTWERAAYIKARVCAGDFAAGNRFLDHLRPFVWRRHLDFAAIQDAHDMRLRIRTHKGLHGPVTLDGHDIKLGRGGIREIEFFTQTRQLIAGGRNPDLRSRRTVEGLGALASADWIKPDVALALTDHYRAHREVEHRLQMINDAQTHKLPEKAEGFAQLADFMDQDVPQLQDALTARLEAVHQLTEGFFAPEIKAPAAPTDWADPVIERWKTYPALRSARANDIFSRLKPVLLDRFSEALKPDEALAQFDRFLAGLPAGVQVFSLFESNPDLTQLIVDICATTPALADYLSRNSGVLDAVIAGEFFATWPGVDQLRSDLAQALAEADDYEAKLLAARRWAKDWHFRTGVHFLRGLIPATQAAGQYADLAEAVLSALWPVVLAEFERKHGQIAGLGAAVVAMGSFGAGRMHAASDLDLIVIYDAPIDAQSDGRRPLAARPYFARLTQALVTALSAPMAEGTLYEVDMRLRPSGRQGPVATSFAAFQDYQRFDAWTWEHLALTRARCVAGAGALGVEIGQFRRDLIKEKSGNSGLVPDVAEMRARIATAKGDGAADDPKLGRGRLQDIELFGQMLALRAGSAERSVAGQLAAGRASGQIAGELTETLLAAAEHFATLQTSLRFLTKTSVDFDSLGTGARRLLLREGKVADLEELRAVFARHHVQSTAIIDQQVEVP